MRKNGSASTYKVNRLHYHDGTTCHGSETMEECVNEAVRREWVGKVLEKVDTFPGGEEVKCYSLIAGAFEHWAKQGTYVAEVKQSYVVETLGNPMTQVSAKDVNGGNVTVDEFEYRGQKLIRISIPTDIKSAGFAYTAIQPEAWEYLKQLGRRP